MRADNLSYCTGRNYTYALWNLVAKDFRVRYRNMSLGILWSILNPLVMLGVLLVVFAHIHPNTEIEFFPVFLLLGLVQYNFFSQCMASGTGCLVENTSFLKKMRFPAALLPVSIVLSNTIHLGIQGLLLAAIAWMSGVTATIQLWWIIYIVAVLIVFLIGAVMVCSCLDVFFRDTQYLVQSVVLVLFWFTPIFYPISRVHDNLRTPFYVLYVCNPLVGCIEAARRVVIHGIPPERDTLLIASVVAVTTFALGLFAFRRFSRRLPDYL